MARPVTFDKSQMIEKIKDTFWQKGFSDTSIADLEEATGLKRTSLYAAYGDKMKMYMLSLAAYKEQSGKYFQSIFEQSDNPLEGIKNFLKASLLRRTEKGCFLVNAGVERHQKCITTTEFINNNTEEVLESLEEQLSAAQAQNLLSQNVNIPLLAQQIFVLNLGVMSGLKSGLKETELFEIIDANINALL
ncbi:MAG: TetR/AcrR family transcriptional regulator [Bacteroidota bacterium]